MSRALRRQMQPYIGKPISVQHTNGRLYHGVLHSITDQGVILRPANGAANASMKIVKAGEEDSIVQAVSTDKKDPVNATPVWWWAWWLIIWALIAGWWWLGAGGWGRYGRGYGAGVGPGYGGYGRGGGLWW